MLKKTKSDLEMIDLVRRGDIAAFEYLVRKYEGRLFVIVGNLLRGSHRIEDIVQETFLAAYKHLPSFDVEKGFFSTWLFRIARNKCFNEQKKKKEMLLDRMPDTQSDHDPATDVMTREMFKKLDQALEQLSFHEKTVFVLAELEGLSYAEISAIEKIPLGTVKSRLSRAKASLRQILKDYMG